MASNSGRKKTKAEVKEYKNAVKLSVTALESTIDTRNANLVGSDELSVPDFPDDTAKEARLPWRIRVKRFIKKHTFEIGLSVVVTILTALVGWYGSMLIDLKVDGAILATKLDTVSTQIESLDTDNVTRELLNIQLDALKKELSYEVEIDWIEIENRISLLEQQIALVQESIQKEEQNKKAE